MKTIVSFLIFLFIYCSAFAQLTLVPYRLGYIWGYSDTLGKIVIEPKYDRADLFYYGEGFFKPQKLVATVVAGNKIFAIDQNGNVLVPGGYESIETSYLQDGIFFIVENAKNKKGLFANGKEIIPCIYDDIIPYPNESYLIQKGKKAGLVNSAGKFLIPVEYDEINEGEGTEKLYKWEAVNGKSTKHFTDKKIIYASENPPPQIVEELSIDEGNIDAQAASLQSKYGLDSTVVKYNMIILYKKDKLGVKINDGTKSEPLFFTSKYWVQDAEYIGNSAFDKVKYNAKTLLTVVDEKGKRGIITETGKIILPFEYNEIFHNGSYLILDKDSKKGFLVLSTPYPFVAARYDKFHDYHSIPVNKGWNFGLFDISKNGKDGYVGENGIEFFKD